MGWAPVMTPTRYHYESRRTRMRHPTDRDAMTYAGLKLAGESGEVRETADSYSTTTLREKIKEVGDVCWYIALISDTLGMDPEILWAPPDPAVCVTWYDATNRLIVAANATSEAIGKAYWHGKSTAAIERKLRLTAAAVHRCAAILGVEVEDIWVANVAKLRERHPDGFSPDYVSESM